MRAGLRRVVHGVSRIAIACLLLVGGPAAAADALSSPAAPPAIFSLSDLGAQLDTRFMLRSPRNAVVLSGAGPLISFCPLLACVLSPSPDHQRAAVLFAAETRDDGHSEEQTVAIETIVRTGALKPWTHGQRFEVGDNVGFSDARNAIYRATVAGVSASSGNGPSGKGADIVDGKVHWQWINDAAIGAKVGLYNELATLGGGGASWGQANNVHLLAGATPSFNVNTELDFSNDAMDCIVGRTNCINLIVSTGGEHQSTSGLYVMSANASKDATHWGLRLAGAHLASEADLEDDAEAPVGIGVGVFGRHSHSRASILDQASGAVSYLITGDHSVASLEDQSTSPASIDIGGRHTIAGLVEQSQSQNGIALNGRYAGAQIVGKGFLIDPEGNLEARSLRATPSATPRTSHTPCRKGQIANDTDFLYACVADNHWRRTALTDF